MSSGSVSGLAAESNAICGTAFWATAGTPARNAAATKSSNEGFMGRFSCGLFIPACTLSCARCLRGNRLQDELLHAPGLNFPDDELVRIAAIHHVDDLEPTELLAGMAEPADDRSVQFQLLDLPGDVPRPRRIAVRIGVGGEHVLVRPRRDANG